MDLDEEVEAPPKRITTAHYIKFINELFDVMDRDETMKKDYWVMDNATIQKSLPMQRKIEIRGYIVIDVTAAIFLFLFLSDLEAKLPFSLLTFKLLPSNAQSIITQILRIMSLSPWSVNGK